MNRTDSRVVPTASSISAAIAAAAAGACHIAVAIAAVALALPAAAVQRTFVHSSPLGNDANTVSHCTQAAPCRSFGAAITVTDPGGEIVILDTAAYGTVTINKSLKIIGPSGVYGGVTVFGGVNPATGITINAGTDDDITLSGLNINGLPGAAPLPLFGIDVQSASTVHIDRVTVSNFTQNAGACIHTAPTTLTRVYVNDSFLRECRAGVFVDGTAAPPAGDRPFAIVDNTRIERGRGPAASGAWLRGFAGLSLRNSVISEQNIGVQFDGLVPNGPSLLELINATVDCGAVGPPSTGLNISSTASAFALVSIVGSQLFNCDDLIDASNSAAGAILSLQVSDSRLSHASNGITVSNSAADANARLFVELIRSQISTLGQTAIDASATNGSKLHIDLRDSTLSLVLGTALKTSGSGSVLLASLVRSTLHNNTVAVDHGQGRIYLDQANISRNIDSLVNNGSGDVKSASNNFITDNIDATPATTYITSFTPVTLK